MRKAYGVVDLARAFAGAFFTPVGFETVAALAIDLGGAVKGVAREKDRDCVLVELVGAAFAKSAYLRQIRLPPFSDHQFRREPSSSSSTFLHKGDVLASAEC